MCALTLGLRVHVTDIPTAAHNEKPQATGRVISTISLWNGRTQPAGDLCFKPDHEGRVIVYFCPCVFIPSFKAFCLPANLQEGVTDIFSHLFSELTIKGIIQLMPFSVFSRQLYQLCAVFTLPASLPNTQTQSVTLSISQVNNTDVSDSSHLDPNARESTWRSGALCMSCDTTKPSVNGEGRAAECILCNMGRKCYVKVLETGPEEKLGRRKVRGGMS